MFDTVLGLPVHVLIIHAVVVLLPLAALLTVGAAVLPARLARLGWLAVALDAGMLAASYVARESGEKLYERLNRPGGDIARHAELGGTLVWFALALLAAGVVAVALRRSAPAVVSAVLAGVVLVAAAAATVQVIRVGHSGSSAVWSGVVEGTGG
jgi:hypothetical protein